MIYPNVSNAVLILKDKEQGWMIQNKPYQWKGSNRKQSTRWQHVSQLKASAFFICQNKLFSGLKHNSFYLGLVLPSGGWQSLILHHF